MCRVQTGETSPVTTVSSSITEETPRPPIRAKDGWILAAVAVAARVACMSVWPARAFSCDLKDWRIIGGAMLVGLNPFDQHYGSLLNWPPMWMEILYGLARISDRLDWPFFSCIRVLLIGCDAVLILSTWCCFGC